MIVADTFVVFHLFNETDLTKVAQKVLKKDPIWILPTLWQEEYANVLSKLARIENRASDEVIHHFSQTLESLHDSEVIVESIKALEISLEYKVSVYDAHFLSLAKDFNAPLVTEDKEILKKCPHIAVSMRHFLS